MVSEDTIMPLILRIENINRKLIYLFCGLSICNSLCWVAYAIVHHYDEVHKRDAIVLAIQDLRKTNLP